MLQKAEDVKNGKHYKAGGKKSKKYKKKKQVYDEEEDSSSSSDSDMSTIAEAESEEEQDAPVAGTPKFGGGKFMTTADAISTA